MLSRINSKRELAKLVHKRTAKAIGKRSLIAMLLADQALGKDPWNHCLPKIATNPEPLHPKTTEHNPTIFMYWNDREIHR